MVSSVFVDINLSIFMDLKKLWILSKLVISEEKQILGHARIKIVSGRGGVGGSDSRPIIGNFNIFNFPGGERGLRNPLDPLMLDNGLKYNSYV